MSNNNEQTSNQREFFYGQAMLGQEAKEAVEDYRHNHIGNLKTLGVVYSMDEILRYISNVFIPFTKNNIPPEADMEWRVGHYFMIYNGQLSFCVIPTLFNKKTGEVIDRYEGLKQTISPSHGGADFHIGMFSDPPGDGEAFDKGDMWP
jgi:hypothetical protein